MLTIKEKGNVEGPRTYIGMGQMLGGQHVRPIIGPPWRLISMNELNGCLFNFLLSDSMNEQ